MGTFKDVRPSRLLAEDQQGRVRRVISEQGQTLVWVMVSYPASGFSNSDRAAADGPGGTGFKLARSDEQHPWRIIDSGTPELLSQHS